MDGEAAFVIALIVVAICLVARFVLLPLVLMCSREPLEGVDLLALLAWGLTAASLLPLVGLLCG